MGNKAKRKQRLRLAIRQQLHKGSAQGGQMLPGSTSGSKTISIKNIPDGIMREAKRRVKEGEV